MAGLGDAISVVVVNPSGAGADVNVTGVNGVAPSVGTGTSDTGTLRVVVASNSTGTTVVTQPTGTNLHAVLDATSTTAVTQATGTNLHAVIDTGSTTAVTQATGTNLHAVIDTGSTTAVTQATATNLNAAVVGTGTAGTPAGNILTIQGVASMTPVQVSQSAVVTGGYTYAHVAAGTATTVIKASAGTLHSITLNGAGVATNVTTVYDHASGAGTVIAIISGALATVPTTLIFDVAFTTGLTIITSIANGGDMTVNFK